MVTSMMVSSEKTGLMDKGLTITKMEVNTLGAGKTTRRMAGEEKSGRMALITKATSYKVASMVQELTNGQMEVSMKEYG